MAKKTPTLATALLATLPLLPGFGEAQLRIVPQAGLYASVSDLGTVDSPDGIRRVGQHQSSLAVGLTFETATSGFLGFRVSGIYGTRSEVPVDGIGCTGSACDLRSTLLGISASLLLRPLPVGFPIRPYLLAGGGAKRYNYDFNSAPSLKDAFGSDSRGAGVLGVGLDWNLMILRGNLEVTDYISGSVLDNGKAQHDFFATVGLFLG